MKIRTLLGVLVLGAMANAACGDDGGTGGSGGTGGTGGTGPGSGGAGATGGGDGGQGGTSDGGQGGTSDGGSGGTGGTGDGGSGGGEGGGGPGADGSPCTGFAQCASEGCLPESTSGFPSGFCTGVCQLDAPDCAGGGACVNIGNDDGTGLCLVLCQQDSDCRAAYTCSVDPGNTVGLCLPGCTADAQCPTVGVCDEDVGSCQQVETECTNGLDDDDDDDADCNDPNCATTCTPLWDAACAGALTATSGNTTTGTTVFGNSCIETPGKTTVHTFTPGTTGQSGTLTVTLTSASEHGLYARSTCNDQATELGCNDAPSGGAQEVLQVPAVGGEPVSVFVTASLAGEEGPYTLAYSFAVSVCGNGTIEPGEECDDGGTLPGDGCTPDCRADFASFCLAATPAVLGPNSGNTTSGPTLFSGSCLADPETHEQIWRFLPITTGTLNLELASDADFGMYVRTDCASDASELDCADFEYGGAAGGMPETLSVPVTAGTPVFIFVDGYAAEDVGPYTLTLSMM